ncbi:hypothetical protein [Nocardioides mesophilus]|uniref:DUF3352 domain-containing protein n=1 Tax=Nocardioides mesophilus TaxID=433659 RepID=A0A7G9REN3_9ACTN|nr:hypothetical protein [Nocardioides mesophilus]QNN54058.1 hypothetical protein H9L09_06675 [Nocardioides mesophilus]
MQRRARVLVTGVATLALVAVLVAAGLVARRLLDRPDDLERAVGTLPQDVLRATYTDWAAVRSAAGGEDLDAGSAPRQVSAFLDRAFEQDLTSTSALAGSTYALEHRFGFSPLEARWEALGQGEQGQVVVLAFDDGTDLGGVERRLRTLGYAEPAGGAGSGGTWAGSADLVAALDPELTPVQQNVAVLPEDGLVLMSDAPGSVSAAAEVVRGDAPALRADGVVAAVAGGAPVTAVLWAGDFACADVSMARADEEDQQAAAALVREAGGVHPLTGLLIAREADGTLGVAMAFESDEQASEDLQARVDLAAGRAVGQGGSFTDRFRVSAGEADGRVVRLELTPRPRAGFVFSDITSGPLLFATC